MKVIMYESKYVYQFLLSAVTLIAIHVSAGMAISKVAQ